MDNMNILREGILRDMSEGVMTIGLDGKITSVNPAAEKILSRAADDMVGLPFATCFFEYEENDAFNQAVLDAIYDPDCAHENYVPYFDGTGTLQLHITTSYLHDNGERIGVIAVINNISELVELRDAVRAMERIKSLNAKLELRNKLLSETFGRFLSDEIVRQLLDTPDGLALGGKKRSLTIMMSDLRGFTALSERMPAQDLITMLNHYLGEMTEIIQSHNGTIIEFIGDGIMAIFGAPAPSETHAADCVAAAVSMEAKMTDVNEWNTAHGYPTLEMGIGINTGEVIVGNIGSEKRTKYGVVGSHVNLAGRIESYTTGGQILISPVTRELITTDLTVAEEQQVVPKGVKVPLTLSHITGIGAPYNVSCGTVEVEPEPLTAPVHVPYYVIRDKHCDTIPNDGIFTAVSSTGAVMESENLPPVFSNLQFDIGEKLFGKVISNESGTAKIRFTSKPTSFDTWVGNIV